jgi:hypothetical protein
MPWVSTQGAEPPEPLEQEVTFARSGDLTTVTGALAFVAPYPLTVVGVRAHVGTAPTGASILVDVHKNGTTLFTTQANRPTIAASATTSGEEIPDVTAVVENDELTVDIDQVGSSIPGADLTVTVSYVQ